MKSQIYLSLDLYRVAYRLLKSSCLCFCLLCILQIVGGNDPAERCFSIEEDVVR